MEILIDVNGSDNGIDEAVKGVVNSIGKTKAKLVMVGDETKIKDMVESLEKWLEGKKVATVFGGVTAKMFDANSGYNMGYTTSDGMNYSDSMATRKGDSNSQGIVGEAVDGINSAIDDMTDGTGYNNTGTTQGGWMDADLKASVTINTSYMEKAIEKAWRNAK